MRFYPLEKLINLHDHYTRRFKIDHQQLLLAQREGRLFLFEADCPHRGHPLDEAEIGEGRLRCPLHGYCFALDDGRLLHYGEEPCRQLRVCEIVYEGNEVGVMLEELPG